MTNDPFWPIDFWMEPGRDIEVTIQAQTGKEALIKAITDLILHDGELFHSIHVGRPGKERWPHTPAVDPDKDDEDYLTAARLHKKPEVDLDYHKEMKEALTRMEAKIDRILERVESGPRSVFAPRSEKIAALVAEHLSKLDPAEEGEETSLRLEGRGLTLTFEDGALDALMFLGGLGGMKFDLKMRPQEEADQLNASSTRINDSE
jgi:hypothetical protein